MLASKIKKVCKKIIWFLENNLWKFYFYNDIQPNSIVVLLTAGTSCIRSEMRLKKCLL